MLGCNILFRYNLKIGEKKLLKLSQSYFQLLQAQFSLHLCVCVCVCVCEFLCIDYT